MAEELQTNPEAEKYGALAGFIMGAILRAIAAAGA